MIAQILGVNMDFKSRNFMEIMEVMNHWMFKHTTAHKLYWLLGIK